MDHKEYKISGVSVLFPCKPYPSQFSMMDKILKGIERRQHCLLESPTGSGKSLALLCSSLAWQAREKAKRDLEEAQEFEQAECQCLCHCEEKEDVKPQKSKNGDEICDMKSTPEPQNTDKIKKSPNGFGPSILDFKLPDYDDDSDFKVDEKKLNVPSNKNSPRTHISIAYEDEKLKESPKTCDACECSGSELIGKTKTKVPKIFFGTRTHKQVAQIVKELRKTSYSDVKMTILGSREHTCIHPQVSKMKNKNEGCKDLLNDQGGCRFKDGTLRLTSQRVIKNLGLSEAWDLEDLVKLGKSKRACPYFLSRGLKDDSDIIICPYNYLVDPMIRAAMMINIKGHIIILDEAHNIEDSAREAASQSIAQDVILKGIQDIDGLMEQGINVADNSKLRSMLKNLDTFINDNIGKLDQKDFNKSYKIWSGFYILAQLEDLGLGPKFYPDLKKALGNIQAEQEERKEEALQAGLNQDSVQMKPATVSLLEQVFQVLEYLYRADLKYVDDYRASLVQSLQYLPRTEEGQWLSSRSKSGGRKMVQTEINTLNFWCMNPGVAFSDFAETRSIILTSGTLSPLTSFESELGLEFKIQLEANHVIKDSQVWVGTLGQGPGGSSLQAVYRNLETFTFQDELGALVLKVCETVPHGVLCFLPSYKVLEKLMARWENIGLMQKIARKKRIISEPRGSDKIDFEEQMNLFYDAVGGCGGTDDDGEPSTINGAVFFAVCRGKVSEGLDFADNFARAVITVGIPYPNFKDVQVELKRKYNDQHKATRGLLSGADWYEIQAFRALNQALGRCIRHRHDWGALIVVDDRFVKSAPKYCKGLSKWVRSKIQTFYNFPCALDSLKLFTEERIEAEKNNPSLDTSTFASSPSPRKPFNNINTPIKPVQNFSIFNAFQTPASKLKSKTLAIKESSNIKTNNKNKDHGDKEQLNHSNKDALLTPTTPSAKLVDKMNKSVLNSGLSKTRFVYKSNDVESSSADNSKMQTPTPNTSEKVLPKEYDSNKSHGALLPRVTQETSEKVVSEDPISKPVHATARILTPIRGVVQAKITNLGYSSAASDTSSLYFPQLRIIAERANPGTRFHVFDIPAYLHSLFGGNLNLPVSTTERLVYLVDPPAGPGQNPTAKLIRMPEDEIDSILKCESLKLNSPSVPAPNKSTHHFIPATTTNKPAPLNNLKHLVSSAQSVYQNQLSHIQQIPAPAVSISNDQPPMQFVPIQQIAGAPPLLLAAPRASTVPLQRFLIGNAGLTPVAIVPASNFAPYVCTGSPSHLPITFTSDASTKNVSTCLKPTGQSERDSVPEVSIINAGRSKDDVVIMEADSSEDKIRSIVKDSNNSLKVNKKYAICETELTAEANKKDSPFPVHLVPNNSVMQLASSVTVGGNTINSPVLFSQSQSQNTPSPVSKSACTNEGTKNKSSCRKPMFKQQSSSKTNAATMQAPVSKEARSAGNIRIAPTKSSVSAVKIVHEKKSESIQLNKDLNEDEEETIQVKRRTKSTKRKSSIGSKSAEKKKKCEESSKIPLKHVTKPAIGSSVYKCSKCAYKLVPGKVDSDVLEQRTTPPFLREVMPDASKKTGCYFFSTNSTKTGLQALADSSLGGNTKYVEQEEICVQFLYCGQCIKSIDNQDDKVAVGSQVQLAAGSGARFSKGQMWLFYGAVDREAES